MFDRNYFIERDLSARGVYVVDKYRAAALLKTPEGESIDFRDERAGDAVLFIGDNELDVLAEWMTRTGYIKRRDLPEAQVAKDAIAAIRDISLGVD